MVVKKFADLLRNLFQQPAPALDQSSAAVAERLQQQVLRLVDNMPTLPTIATRARALAASPTSSLGDLAELIEGDAAMATRILRLANSSAFAGGSAALKLPQAVVRLGMRRCQNLILAVSTQRLFQSLTGPAQAQCAILWQHSQLTGWLCRELNRGYRLGFDGEEFSAGLLHDLGRILLAMADIDAFTRAGAMSFREPSDVLEREQAAVGIDHAALGACFGEHSSLPDALVQTMRWHHAPAQAPAAVQTLVALTAATDHIANHLQAADDLASYDPHENAGLELLWSRWPDPKKSRFLADLPMLMARAADVGAEEEMD